MRCCLVPRCLSHSLSLRAKGGGKEKGGETSGRSCFQDGGMFNGGRLRIFKNEFRPVHFAYLEQKNSMSTFSVPRGGCFLLK